DIYAENLRIDTEAFENCESGALDYQNWTEVVPEKIPQRQHFCLRATFAVSADQARQPLVLKLSMLAASHIYWDGVLVGKNGQVGTDQASETPGEIDYALPIPAELTSAGKHLVTIKASSYHLD